MSSVFTDYVRSLEAGGAPPAVEDFDRLWSELRKVLTRELKRRHLWSRPPSYLGIYGWRSWTDGPEAPALEDLASDCYVFVFLDRLRSLKAQASAKPDIEGLVSLHVRNFLHTAQKRQDPLGFKVFDLLRSALRQKLSEGSLYVLKGPKNVRNDTVFGFAAAENPKNLHQPFGDADVVPLSDAILPALVSARRGTAEAVDLLAARISELPERGVSAFRFGDLVDPLKVDVRSRWAKILEELGGEAAPQFDDGPARSVTRFVALTRPDADFEERDWFEKLVECVDRGLQRTKLRRRTREYLEKLWAFLCRYALEVEEAALPSHRKLADLLELPRERLPGLYETLGGVLEQCRLEGSAMLRGAAGKAGPQGAAPAGVRSMDVRARREQLRLRTGEALARLAEPEVAPTSRPRPGDLYVVDGTGDVEWAVLLRAAGGCLLVPADPHPLTGSDDVAVGRESASGPLNLRCGFAVWVDERRLAGAARSGVVEPGVVARAQAKVAEPEEGEAAVLPARLEADRDPEYEDWARDVLEPARDALSAVRRSDVGPRRRGQRRPEKVVPLALAAALLAAVVGLSVLWRQVAVLSEPTVDVDRHEIAFQERPRSEVLVIDPEASHVLLPLLLRSPSHESYTFEVVNGGGEIVWRRSGLEPRLQYRLLVPRSRLPAGVYRFRLYGITDGAEVLVDEQQRRIEYDGR